MIVGRGSAARRSSLRRSKTGCASSRIGLSVAGFLVLVVRAERGARARFERDQTGKQAMLRRSSGAFSGFRSHARNDRLELFCDFAPCAVSLVMFVDGFVTVD